MKYAHMIIGVPDEQEPEQVALEILADFSENNYDKNPEQLEQIFARIVGVNSDNDVLYIGQDGNYGDARDLCLLDTYLWSKDDEEAFSEISMNDSELASFASQFNGDPSLTPAKYLLGDTDE